MGGEGRETGSKKSQYRSSLNAHCFNWPAGGNFSGCLMSIEGSAENDLLLYYELSKSVPKEAVVSIAGFRHYVMEHNFVQYSVVNS